MSDEVIYKFVRGQGWVPRTESDDFIGDFDKEVANKVRELLQREFNVVYVPMPRWLFEGV